MIDSPVAVVTALAAVAAGFLFVERVTKWRVFSFLPPLLFIYFVPMVLSNTGVLAHEGPVYDWMSETMLPFLLVIVLLKVDVVSAVRVMGRGMLVMLCGSAGVILGAPLVYSVVKGKLDPTAWKAFGSLAGSWIGGTANMAAVGQGIGASGTEFGLAVLGDNMAYIVWLPILLASKGLAPWFNRFTRVDPRRIEMLERAGAETKGAENRMALRHFLYLLFLGFAATLLATHLSRWLPEFPPVFTAGSWKILLVTTFGLLLSATPARTIPGSQELGMALIYLFVANMGARANLAGLREQAAWFLPAAYLWVAFHGLACVLGARLFHVDIHSTAIASVANVGGVAGASLVAAHHNPRLVPVGILMALMGFALGTYGGFLAAWLCQQVS
ncbi:MAG: DUF819 family protein [Sedimentisphaerales bacterium]|nr:DUF819 family protein [Sedimentisphaerales bacterium]